MDLPPNSRHEFTPSKLIEALRIGLPVWELDDLRSAWKCRWKSWCPCSASPKPRFTAGKRKAV
jgi:hypothetical protein